MLPTRDSRSRKSHSSISALLLGLCAGSWYRYPSGDTSALVLAPTFTSPLLAERLWGRPQSPFWRRASAIQHLHSETEDALVVTPAESDDSSSPLLLRKPPDRTTSVEYRLGDLRRDVRGLRPPCMFESPGKE
jgi:hypothetical protein